LAGFPSGPVTVITISPTYMLDISSVSSRYLTPWLGSVPPDVASNQGLDAPFGEGDEELMRTHPPMDVSSSLIC
jgi:hypothetical protein